MHSNYLKTLLVKRKKKKKTRNKTYVWPERHRPSQALVLHPVAVMVVALFTSGSSCGGGGGCT